MTLTLTQQGALVTGTIDLFAEPTAGAVSGQVDSRNHLSLKGVARNEEHQGQFTIEEWDTHLDESGRQMLGSWRADAVFANGFGLQHQKEQYELTGVVKQTP